VLRLADGRLQLRSSAVAQLLRQMGGVWTGLGWALWLVPRPLRDWAYDLMGSVRFRLFGHAPDVCPVTPPTLRARIDSD